MMLPNQLIDLIQEELRKSKREPDGMLHPSSHLLAPLRHVQLELAGAPKVESELLSDITLETGTMWHKRVEGMLLNRHVEVMVEVDLTKGLPGGWSGTADYVWRTPNGWVLGDLKTIKGEGIPFVVDSPKEDHIWQASAYYWALDNLGYNLADEFFILYLPKNDIPRTPVAPVFHEWSPIPREEVWERMQDRKLLVDAYLDGLPPNKGAYLDADNRIYLTEALADPAPREQKLYRKTRSDDYEVKLVPHWTSRYCPFPDELCDCSQQGTTKIGEWRGGGYWPRKGYEQYEPEVRPLES
jgi:hypothetical protein